MVPRPARTSLRSHVRVYHKDKEGILHSLQKLDLLEKILDEVSRGENPTEPRVITRADRERMKERGFIILQPKELDIIIEFPWDARSFFNIVVKANDEGLRRRVLVMALDRIRSTPTLRKVLAAKGLPNCTIRQNPYLRSGHAPYENFMKSLHAVTDGSTPTGEKLFELLLESAADDADVTAFKSVEQLGVKMVFHGTNHAVMDAILKSGLDPSCRRSDAGRDYFGVSYPLSLHYTRLRTLGSLPTMWKLLVFMIIMEPADPRLFSFHSNDQAVAVASNKFQVPLAEITLALDQSLCQSPLCSIM